MAVGFKQLRYFIAVAEELSFSRAAERLHISQPPLSVQIKRLEENIGTPLLERSTRQVELTDAGRVFLEDARQLLNQLEQSVHTAWRVGHGQIGRLRLGFVPSASSNILPPLLRAFREQYPDVTTALTEASPADQVDMLRSGLLDAAIFYLPSPSLAPFGYSNLASQVILEEPLVAVFPEGHKLTSQRRIRLQALASESFVLVAAHRGPGLRDIILAECQKAGFLPHVVQEATLIQTIGGLVASGVGVAVVPASLRRVQPIGVDYRPLQGKPALVRIGIIWNRDTVNPILPILLHIAKEQSQLSGAELEHPQQFMQN